MTTEEKAKAYDEAIRKAAALYKASEPMSGCNVILETLFPELKESEGEKIRKMLIRHIEQERGSLSNDEAQMAIVWLENQGGQKPQGKTALEAINEEKVDNANKVEPRQEKLTKFEKAVKQVMEEAIECGDTHNLKADAEMLLSLAHSSTWSKEDEEIINGITSYLCTHDSCELDGFNKWYDFLKYLKERYTWKPSDEQLKSLQEVIDVGHFTSYPNSLETLYEQLKKLREE